jgi:hypothetical protein
MYIFEHISLSFSYNEYVSGKSRRENKTTFLGQHIIVENFAFLTDNAEEYCTSEQATDDNMEHAHCMLKS